MARTVWFPGHMAKGTRKLSELSGKLDLLLEVRDARAPEATSSPMVRNLSREILVWTILAKRDLAAEETTKEWLRFFEKRGGKAWALNLLTPKVDALRRALVSAAVSGVLWPEAASTWSRRDDGSWTRSPGERSVP